MSDSRPGNAPAASIADSDSRLARTALAILATLVVLFALACKALLFHDLEYTASDLYSFLEMSRSWLRGAPLLYENAYGSHAAIHGFYLVLAFAPLTWWLGAYGLFAGLALLQLLAALRVALTPALDLRGRLAVLGGLLSPFAWYVPDNPGYGFHPELCYPPLAVLLALALVERRRGQTLLAAVALVLVKEDGALVCAAVLAAHYACRLWAARAGPDDVVGSRREAVWSLGAAGAASWSGCCSSGGRVTRRPSRRRPPRSASIARRHSLAHAPARQLRWTAGRAAGPAGRLRRARPAGAVAARPAARRGARGVRARRSADPGGARRLGRAVQVRDAALGAAGGDADGRGTRLPGRLAAGAGAAGADRAPRLRRWGCSCCCRGRVRALLGTSATRAPGGSTCRRSGRRAAPRSRDCLGRSGLLALPGAPPAARHAGFTPGRAVPVLPPAVDRLPDARGPRARARAAADRERRRGGSGPLATAACATALLGPYRIAMTCDVEPVVAACSAAGSVPLLQLRRP